MDDVVTLVLPLPPKELSPNARGHWSKRARAVKAYRARAEAEARRIPASRRVRWECAELRAVWYPPDMRRRDPDNLMASLKSAIDGLVDADLIADDRSLVILPTVVNVDRMNPRVEIEVRGLTRPRLVG